MNGSKIVTRKRAQRGFTLIEILIVVVILGILAAIVIPQFSSASDQAGISSIRSQLQTLRSQVELYSVQNGGTDPDDGTINSTTTSETAGGFQTLVDEGYLQRLPEVPAGWQINLAGGEVTAEWIGNGDAPNELTAEQIAGW